MAKKKTETEEIETKEAEEKAADETGQVETGQVKKKKEKSVVRRRKAKEKENPLIVAIRLAVESGKTEFGVKSGLAAFLTGKATLFVVAEDAPKEYQNKIFDLANKSKIPIIVFPGSTMELGAVCGKPFPVSVLSVYDVGNSNLMSYVKK